MAPQVAVGTKVELVPVDHRNTDVALVHMEVEASTALPCVFQDLEGDMVAKHKVGPSAEHGDPEVSSMSWVAQRLVCSSWEVCYQDQVVKS
jgi:hypothetical protein